MVAIRSFSPQLPVYACRGCFALVIGPLPADSANDWCAACQTLIDATLALFPAAAVAGDTCPRRGVPDFDASLDEYGAA